MKNFETKISLGQYKAKELFWYFDELSEEERVLAYRMGWKIFDENKMFFEDFYSFHKRKGALLQVLGYFLALCLFLSVVYILFVHPSSLKYALAGFVLAGSIMTFFVVIGKARKNLSETKRFFNFIDPIDKKENFKEFLSLSSNDLRHAETFYSNLRKGNDYQEEQSNLVEYDKTVSLLAIEMMLGELGVLNELKQKLIQSDQKIKSGSFDKVVSSVVGGTDRGIRDYFSKISPEISNSRRLSAKRKEQLIKVKEIFINAGLREKAVDIDDFIQERTDL
ncbi:hypothetical protein [Algoriphagus pacificus]|uniref:SMODS and SLOG-associating 2TM effector domain-containing protein n=1 Tax=Algoriphagus pacificus TaxID=2811234 RepID=A0ABS3CM15_9BACT|nr:hypothetical protein [Algoriphagus pacificus]MBN7817285.1 hypothetical protein [Algoriphagus pacificus]